MRKKLFSVLVALFALTSTAMAQQESVTIADVSMEVGEEAVLEINYQLPAGGTYVGFLFHVVLPEGLSLVEDPDDPGYPWYDDEVTAISKLSITTTESYGFAATPKKASSTINGTSGVLMRLKVKADATLASGTYTGTVSELSFNLRDANYNVTKSKLADVTFNVVIGGGGDEPVTITANNYTRQYGEANPTFGYTVSGADLVGVPSVSCTATATSPVGTYPIVITQGTVQNGSVTYVNGTLTITKAPLTIKAGDYTMRQGGQLPTFTPSYEGFKNNENSNVLTKQPTISCTAAAESTPGEYVVYVSGAEAQNYNISYVNGTLTVTDSDAPVEVTDITTMADAIYIEPFEARLGDEVDIEVKVKNAAETTSYGFELVLPEGMTIATDTDGAFDDAVTLSARNSKHSVTTNKLADNTYKLGVASLSSKALTDNDGVVLTIKASVAETMAVGTYPVVVKSPLIVYTDGTKPTVQQTQTAVTVEDYKNGDVDGDDVVDLADAVLVINYYVGKPVSTFVQKAADVDGDGVIDLADAVLIINYYVGKIPSLSRDAETQEREAE